MFIDAQGTFSKDQALTASAISQNIIDLGVDGNIGVGEPMALVCLFQADLVATGTYSIILESSSDEAFTSPVELSEIKVDPSSVEGDKVVMGVPADSRADRFLRVSYVLGGTSPAMEVSSFLQPQNMVQNNYVFADAITIS